MFRRIDGLAERPAVAIEVEGRRISAREGDTLALALLAGGVRSFREAPRAPLCLMGVCFDCLVEVDGVANLQACMLPVRQGMRVRLQHGARKPGADS